MTLRLANGVAALGLVACAGLWGCSTLVDPDPRTLDPEPMVCEPGSVVRCLCNDGQPHMQRCNDGGGFDPCNCPIGQASGTGHAGPVVAADHGSAGQGAK